MEAVTSTFTVQVPPAVMGLAEKLLAIVGACTAVRVAEPDPFDPVLVPDSLEEMNPVVLTCGPTVVALMFTCAVQLLLAGIVPPLKLMTVAPAVGPKVGDPLQVVLADGVAATSRPVGRVSEKAAPVSADVLGLVRVKVSVEVPLSTTVLGEKALLRVGFPQPVKVTSSKYTSEPGLSLPEFDA